MERIAVISDIHGNLPSFEAVLKDIRERGIKRIHCLGDLVGKGPSSAEVVDLVRERCEIVVQGNWDDLVNRERNEVLDWHRERLGPERLQYLDTLPYCHDFVMSGRTVRLYHASAKGLYHRVQPWFPVEERLAMFEDTEWTDGDTTNVRKPDVIGYGDVHNAFIQHLKNKMLFNPGSVGNPLDMAQAAYAVLEGAYASEAPAPFSVQLVRVPYNIELAVSQAAESGMPQLEAYARELRTSRYRGLSD